jgi:5-methylcytosine-specific restriction endonuclease McrA
MPSSPTRPYVESRFARRSHVKCAYCPRMVSRADATVDHRIPVSRGGSHKRSNLAIACFPCNSRKKNMTEVEFREALRTGHWPKTSLIGKDPFDPHPLRARDPI